MTSTAAPEQQQGTTDEPGTDLATMGTRHDLSVPTALGPPSATEWAAMQSQAETLARSRLVPSALRGKTDDVLLIVMVGRELAIPPVMALSKVHVVEGKPTLAAETMRALVKRAGHRFKVKHRSPSEATVWGLRKGDHPEDFEEVTWTLEMARQAGLANKDVWKKYPTDMLVARATSALCRSLFPDVLMGVSYTPEEMGDDSYHVEVGEAQPNQPQRDPVDLPYGAQNLDQVSDLVRAAIFDAFDAEDPEQALRDVWVEGFASNGDKARALPMADADGELVTGFDVFKAAVDAMKAGKRLEDKAVVPQSPLHQQPDPDAPPSETVDGEAVEDHDGSADDPSVGDDSIHEAEVTEDPPEQPGKQAAEKFADPNNPGDDPWATTPPPAADQDALPIQDPPQ
jgi:hypothetical protein